MTRTMTRRFAAGALACSAIALLVAMAPGQHGQDGQNQMRHGGDKAIAPSGLIAVVYPTEGNEGVKGVVRFVERDGSGGVRVTARIEGLKPNSKHGFHVHEFGDASAPDGTSAGDHHNPDGHDHGLPHESGERHAGDFGNIETDGQGVGVFDLTVDNLVLTGGREGGKYAILGRSVIVHADPDDGGQPLGNAGPRIGIGIIGIAQPRN